MDLIAGPIIHQNSFIDSYHPAISPSPRVDVDRVNQKILAAKSRMSTFK